MSEIEKRLEANGQKAFATWKTTMQESHLRHWEEKWRPSIEAQMDVETIGEDHQED